MFKKVLILAIILNLIIPKLLIAQQEVDEFRKPIIFDFSKHTPVNSGLRSAILPGWGQFFNEQETKGYIVASAAFGTVLASYLLYVKANKTYEDYEKFGAKNGPLYSDYETQQQQAMLVSILAVGVWIYASVDAYITAKYSGLNLENLDNKESSKINKPLRISSNGKGIKLVYLKRF